MTLPRRGLTDATLVKGVRFWTWFYVLGGLYSALRTSNVLREGMLSSGNFIDGVLVGQAA
jgi:hypothetical protein